MVEKYKWLPNALFVDVYGEHVKSLVAQTMQWCEQHDSPLLVPLSKWLESPESLLITHVEHLDGGTDKLAITSYNQHVFFSTRNHEICMYHVPSKKLVRKLGGHSDRINFVLLSYNNKFLLSGSDDKTVRMWNLASGELQSTFKLVSSHLISSHLDLSHHHVYDQCSMHVFEGTTQRSNAPCSLTQTSTSSPERRTAPLW